MNTSKPKLKGKIRKGDKVIAISGNYRGQTGIVLSRDADKAVVQGLNVKKKHVKASQANPKGGIIELEKPIDISNLQVCDSLDKPIKLKVRSNVTSGERELYHIVDGKEVLHRTLRKS